MLAQLTLKVVKNFRAKTLRRLTEAPEGTYQTNTFVLNEPRSVLAGIGPLKF